MFYFKIHLSLLFLKICFKYSIKFFKILNLIFIQDFLINLIKFNLNFFNFKIKFIKLNINFLNLIICFIKFNIYYLILNIKFLFIQH